ncbi:MAG: Ldh family oxidoreductase [Chloroflexi bacterium]|nr:Ldh family oxidoreductase [Chloroflexota bacterium]
MPLVMPAPLAGYVGQIFAAAGAPPPHAAAVAESLVASNLVGHDSHGVVRVPQYLASIARGETDPAAVPYVARERGVVAVIDAQRGFGQLAARVAIGEAIGRAQRHGLSAVTIERCSHAGRMGEWVELAAAAGLIGLAFCNAGRPLGPVAPHGGAGRALGTNPVAAAIPHAGAAPIVVDFATSTVAEGKLRIAFNQGQPIPAGLILDAAGHPSTDPGDFYRGGVLLPMAGHKGYALALLVELLGGVLAETPGDVIPGGNGVLFIVLDPAAFRDPAAYAADVAAFCARVVAVPPAPGFAAVMLPGEPERRTRHVREHSGIPLDDTTWHLIVECGLLHGVAAPAEGT